MIDKNIAYFRTDLFRIDTLLTNNFKIFQILFHIIPTDVKSRNPNDIFNDTFPH
jgi:hypothetical protein